ncbi:MAG: response regulator, partial [Sphingomonadaceae bacterium]
IQRSSEAFFTQLPANIDYHFEHRIIRGDGQLRWLRWTLRREGPPEGSARIVYGSVQDITSARANERQVKALQLRAERRVRELDRLTTELGVEKQRAERALKARTDFLSYMAHQFRTPLNSFFGALELTSIEPRNPEDEYRLAIATRAAERLSSLVEEILSEVDEAPQEVRFFHSPVDIVELIEKTDEYWRTVLSGSDNSEAVSITQDGALPEYLDLDRLRIHEMLDNLIGCSLTNTGKAHLSVRWNDGLAISLLCDSVPPSQIPALLEQEPQLRRVSALVRGMDGVIRIGEGDAPLFTVTLPAQIAETPSAPSLPPLLNHMGKTPEVLVAEDTESNRFVLVSMLEQLGCRVQEVENGIEALQAATNRPFDIILMDVQMPVMNGNEAVRAIREADEPYCQTPVIGVTAHTLSEERERLLDAGMSACISKPVQMAELRAALTAGLTAFGQQNEAVPRFDPVRFREAFTALPENYRKPFLDAIRDDLDRFGAALQNAVTSGDEDLAEKQAHAIKGVAANIGATHLLSGIARFREGGSGQWGTTWPEMSRALDATRTGCSDLYDAMIADQDS